MYLFIIFSLIYVEIMLCCVHKELILGDGSLSIHFGLFFHVQTVGGGRVLGVFT